jgi:hypothetical protein
MKLHRYWDSRTGQSFNVNLDTGIVCGQDGQYPDATTEQRVLRAVGARRRQAANRRDREDALRSCGLVKVRGALGGVYWE